MIMTRTSPLFVFSMCRRIRRTPHAVGRDLQGEGVGSAIQPPFLNPAMAIDMDIKPLNRERPDAIFQMFAAAVTAAVNFAR